LTIEGRIEMNNLGAAKRLRKELQSLEKAARNGDSDTDIYLRPTSSSSLLHWTALIRGPVDTPYEGGVFRLSIRCGTDYPLAPPTIVFDTKIFHPNVHFGNGDVCLDILKKEWSPAWGLQAACRAVLALLSDPDADSPLNCDAGNMVRGGDKLAFYTTAEMYTLENAFFITWPTEERSASAVKGSS
jgi:peroxin-4